MIFFHLFQMSLNIPQRAEIIIHNIVQNTEDGNENICGVSGVKRQIIENPDTVGKTDRAPRAAVCISLYSDGLDFKNSLSEKGRNSVNGKNTVVVNLYSDGFDSECSSSKKGINSVNGKNTVVVNLYSDGFDIENSLSRKERKSVNGKNTVVVNYLVSKL